MTEQKSKVPGQFFQWFDSLRQGYESSIHKLFHRVEKVNEDHNKQIKTVYQSQIDGLKKTYQDHLHTLKDNHQTQSSHSESRIRQLEKDARFYQDQIQRQNQTIDRLNDRYDAVIFALMDQMDRQSLENMIKDISPADREKRALHHEQEQSTAQITDSKHIGTEHSDEHENSEQSNNQSINNKQEQPQGANAFIHEMASKLSNTDTSSNGHDDSTPVDQEEVLQQAFDARQEKKYKVAYDLFLKAAKAGNEKAMGAIGRAHFVGEGTTADKTTGLAWLIIAAKHQFEPALKKVASAEEKSPELYEAALKISQGLLSSIH